MKKFDIHQYLQNRKWRIFLLMTPITFCVICLGLMLIGVDLLFAPPKWMLYTYLFSMFWVIIASVTIVYSDYKSEQKRFKQYLERRREIFGQD